MDAEGENRGTKRKAEGAINFPQVPKRIKALDQNVINKIAAGEIIVAPMHALKELIENAVDAGSTTIEIAIKDGGLKLLQITDNGQGINKEDLPILCERFTTSKLRDFEDLTTIATYGFRGEALASISHIAHLTITTKTADSSCAWRAHYSEGKLIPAKPGQSTEPKPVAGRGGTQITVEDLFYNVPQRKKAFKSQSEEYAKILDVVGKYAIHCDGVAFSCRKHGESTSGISVSLNASALDRIRQIHGTGVANELVEFEVSDLNWGFRANGLASNANYHVKKTTILLFINHRSVESSALRLAIQRTYSPFLPKGGHPFVYLNIEIEPQRVDVNVHPTKREVSFLNEDDIIELICEVLRKKLAQVDTSRTFMTQTLLSSPKLRDQPSTAGAVGEHFRRKSVPRPAENNLVRTDHSIRKITSMIPAATLGESRDFQSAYELTNKPHMQIRLSSIRELRAGVREAMHGALTEMFSVHTYVGLIDVTRRLAAIQSGVKLYIVDYGMICNEFFYQIGLTDFGNFGSMEFSEPLDIEKLVALGVDVKSQSGESLADLSKAPQIVTKNLIDQKDMLLEYFSMEVTEDGFLKSIPILLKGYLPSLSKLPTFLLRLGPCVDWFHEKECFHTFLTELASFYVPEELPKVYTQATEQKEKSGGLHIDSHEVDIDGRRKQLEYMLEHSLFPSFKTRLVATKGILKGVVEVANLKDIRIVVSKYHEIDKRMKCPGMLLRHVLRNILSLHWKFGHCPTIERYYASNKYETHELKIALRQAYLVKSIVFWSSVLGSKANS